MSVTPHRRILVAIDFKAKTMERYVGRVCTDAVEVEGDITEEKVATFRLTPELLEPSDKEIA